jgi:hypothetical protein
MKLFCGRRLEDGVDVTVDGVELPPRHDLVDYATPLDGGSFGYDWGLGNRGAAALALAILATSLNDALAVDFHQRFKWAVVARLSGHAWRLTSRDVEAWFVLPSRRLAPRTTTITEASWEG